MSAPVITEKFLAEIAGWEAMKRARALLDSDKVLSSNWTPPILKGVVQDGVTSYRAGLVIRGSSDIDNMCGCREARQWGTMCSHSVAVGLHLIRALQPPAAKPTSGATPARAVPEKPESRHGRCLRRAEPGAAGESIRLHVILPPNLVQAIARDTIMVCLEAEWRRGRTPLNVVDKFVPFRLEPADAPLLDQLEALADGETPGLMQLRGEAFARLLPKLAGHPRVTLGKSQAITISTQPWTPPLEAALEPNGEIVLTLRGAPAPAPATILKADKAWVLQRQTLQPVGLPSRYLAVLDGPLRLTRLQIPLFLGQDWAVLQQGGAVAVNFSLDDFSFAPQAPRFHLELTGGLAQLQGVLQGAYGPRIMTLGVTRADEAHWLPDPDSPTRYATRDLAAEQAAQARLLRAGFRGPDAQGHWQLSGQNDVLNFFARDWSRLTQEWTVHLDERLDQSVARNIERVEPSLKVIPSGENWFDLQVDYRTSSGESLSAAEIQRLLLSGQSHRRLNNGRIAVIDTGAVEELQEVLTDCAPQQLGGGYRLSNVQAGFLAATVDQGGWRLQAPEDWTKRVAGGPEGAACPPLGDLEERLRPYQKTGVAWLDFLRRNGSGGILADDMGLGKTVQMLAFLRALQPSTPRPSLIVCPTSLVHNWVAEAAKFTPSLRVLPLHGPDRAKRFADIPRHDLIITSYALIRRDADLYRGLEFEVAALDEAQHIKNRQTQNAQAVKSIRARHRFVLTGTPMENSVLDLWSIFDFLIPGYLGSARDFRERYELPVAREKHPATQTRLARRIRPFLLRRLKKDVARDLPDKIEQVSFCDLTDAQAAVYRQVLEAGRQQITASVGDQGLAKSRILIFTTLLRLRQICCDLRLLKLEAQATRLLEGDSKATTGPRPVPAGRGEGGLPASRADTLPPPADAAAGDSSGKLELFDELIEEALDGGHRVLVFSQFTSLLALIRQRLETEKIECCYLDGSTTNRPEVVARFQNNEGIPVFLLSLKAGGVGLNLTGADTVIHLDPWWNPAVEDQATDRAHRIGQTRVVTSYKLITRGTVEEKILHLQQRKRDLLKGALGDEQALSNLLTWDEIVELMN